MITTVYHYPKSSPPPGTFIDARGSTSVGGVVMAGTLKLKLKGHATAEEIAAIEIGMLNATHERNHLGWVYANAMERAWDIHGMDGLKPQIACMLLYLGEWHGADARNCKRILREFSK